MEEEGYKHFKVNHSVNYKDPESGQHTNTIEGLWRHAKFSLPQFHRKKQFIAGYLAKFMFHKMCKAQKLDPLVEFFKMAGSIYDATKIDSVEIEETEESDSENESLSGDDDCVI